MSARLHFIVNRDTGELRTVTTEERQALVVTGDWLPVCSEPDELTKYKRPTRLHRSRRLAELVRDQEWLKDAERNKSQSQINAAVDAIKRAKRADRIFGRKPASDLFRSDNPAHSLASKALFLGKRHPVAVQMLNDLADKLLARLES
jgi:hypothetical protein